MIRAVLFLSAVIAITLLTGSPANAVVAFHAVGQSGYLWGAASR